MTEEEKRKARAKARAAYKAGRELARDAYYEAATDWAAYSVAKAQLWATYNARVKEIENS